MSKIITGKGRFSYLNWASPKKNELSGKEEFSTEFLIPKSDEETVKNLKAAMKNALTKKFGDKIPGNMRNPLRDGDTTTKSDGSPLGPEYKGHWFIRCKSSEAPGVVDSNRQPLVLANDFVSGDYGRISVTAFAYDQAGNKGVSFYWNNAQLISKGEALGSRASAADDFAGGFSGGSEDETMPF